MQSTNGIHFLAPCKCSLLQTEKHRIVILLRKWESLWEEVLSLSLSLILVCDPSYRFVWVLEQIQPDTCTKTSCLFSIVRIKNLDLPVFSYMLLVLSYLVFLLKMRIVYFPPPCLWIALLWDPCFACRPLRWCRGRAAGAVSFLGSGCSLPRGAQAVCLHGSFASPASSLRCLLSLGSPRWWLGQALELLHQNLPFYAESIAPL